MSRSQIKSDLPVEISERVKNIDNLYKIHNTKLTPISRSYPLVSSDAPRVEIYFPNDAILNFRNAILEAEISLITVEMLVQIRRIIMYNQFIPLVMV
jgi:hypothetical protein